MAAWTPAVSDPEYSDGTPPGTEVILLVQHPIRELPLATRERIEKQQLELAKNWFSRLHSSETFKPNKCNSHCVFAIFHVSRYKMPVLGQVERGASIDLTWGRF
ncbi:hypothetical protein TNCV_620611 [Trichonephila clavipes]|nr:hypothetical protein TNCV_620611 [Trichonephila clavipes]